MQAADEHAKHSNALSSWVIGAAGVSMLASFLPYILPAIGIGDAAVASDMATNLPHTHAGTGPEGLAGVLHQGISSIPLVGGMLAAGGIGSILATGGIGIGGVLLAKWMEKHENPHASIRWSTVIRGAALVTSALIAMPSLLTGLTVGLSFLAMTFAPQISSAAISLFTSTLGVAAGHSGAGAVAASLPHLVLCGATAIPVVGSMLAGRHRSMAPEENQTPAPQVSQAEWQARLNAPAPALHMARA
ncbi:MAG: hypothetical protein DI582_10700 [Azospirillum brasilense]|nr:MAG: hypothetical protein DI582_10700 [Azospirillum brasilense]